MMELLFGKSSEITFSYTDSKCSDKPSLLCYNGQRFDWVSSVMAIQKIQTKFQTYGAVEIEVLVHL